MTPHYSLSQFLTMSLDAFIDALNKHHRKVMNMPPDEGQLTAWQNCFISLQQYLPELLTTRPVSKDWMLIFEYELPRERGRRPDVILLAGSTILVLEYKDFQTPLQAHIDQVAAYARDLSHYHACSHGRRVIPILVPTQTTFLKAQRDEVYITSPDRLPDLIDSLVTDDQTSSINPIEWLNADYAPLPTLIAAARTIFNHEPLPYIRRAHSAGIPDTIAELIEIADQAQANGQHHLALVTGVPGAGKTLVGLQFVYHNHFNSEGAHRTAVFLSGNGPLVKVLQHALRSSIFVQDVHGFLKQYGGSNRQSPAENIFVFDEAQRAWDSDRVREKRGHTKSEPDDFLQIGQKKSWALMVGLIGDGQEIHLGEEAGLSQWNDAISNSNASWTVHCPERVAHFFTAASAVKKSERLDLTATLRSHLAEDVQLWVKHLLDGDLSGAAAVAEKVNEQGFDMYVTQDIDKAKGYVQSRYAGFEDARYGLLASSKAKNLEVYGIRNSYQFTKNLREGPFYNDPISSRSSCCQLKEVATEFACQGLELDFPLIGWGDDLRWNGSRWISPPTSARSKAKNPHRLRLNSYRVLLTRGRDGFIVFVPPEPLMKTTYDALLLAGLLPLQ